MTRFGFRRHLLYTIIVLSIHKNKKGLGLLFQPTPMEVVTRNNVTVEVLKWAHESI